MSLPIVMIVDQLQGNLLNPVQHYNGIQTNCHPTSRCKVEPNYGLMFHDKSRKILSTTKCTNCPPTRQKKITTFSLITNMGISLQLGFFLNPHFWNITIGQRPLPSKKNMFFPPIENRVLLLQEKVEPS